MELINDIKNDGDISDDSDESKKFCRICFSTKTDNEFGKFIRPCLCKGTIEYVHENCLKEWINISDKKKCTICLYNYRKYMKVYPIIYIYKLIK